MLFKGIFLVLLIVFMGIRIHWRKIWTPIPRQAFHDRRERILTSIFALSMALVSLLWLGSDVLAIAALEYHLGIRIAGLLLAVGGVVLLARVHAALGVNFSPRLELQDKHQLIQSGPYRWMRHPMYSSGFLFVIGCGLWAANAVVLIVPLAALSLLVGLRLSDEEAMLQKRFGEEWEEHCQRTGRILPRFFS